MNEPPVSLYEYQRAHVESVARFNWMNWSRQTGKSFASTLRRVLRGLRRRRNQIFLSSSERQSRELMMKAKQHVQALDHAFEFVETDMSLGEIKYRQLEIVIPALDMRLIGLPANPDTARGFTGDVLLDEFAMHKDSRAIWGSVFPSVLRGDGELDVCSTPKGKANKFYELAGNEEFHRSTLTIHDAIADGLDVDPEVLYRALGDEDLWQQEFLCQFVDDATAFLTYDMIAGAEDARLNYALDFADLEDTKQRVYVGVDIGRRRDLTVIWLFVQEGLQLRHLGIVEMTKARFADQFDMLCQILEHRSVRKMCIDASGLGMQLAEQTAERYGLHRVEECTFTAQFKAQIAGWLRVRIEGRSMSIPVSVDLRNDLHSVQRMVTSAGNITLQASRENGSHADRFWAGALAVYAADSGLGDVEVRIPKRALTSALRYAV